jgi:uncharacterized membrane protein YccC
VTETIAQPSATPLKRLERVGRMTTPSPAFQHAIRLGAATSGALWLAYAAGLPKPTWPVITVMMVVQPTAGASVQKGFFRILGTIVAAFAAIALYGLFGQDHLLLATSICFVYAVAVYGMTGPSYPYAWTVFGFTTGIILGGALPGTDQIEVLAFDRASLVLLGLLASFAAQSVFWPVRPEPQLRESLAARAARVASSLRTARESVLAAGPPPEIEPAESPPPLIAQLGFVDQLRSELGMTRARTHAFARVAIGLDGLAASARLLSLTNLRHEESIPEALLDPLRALLDRSCSAAEELGRALAEARRPEAVAGAVADAMSRLDDERIADLVALVVDEEEDAQTSSRGARDAAAFASRLAAELRSITSLIGDVETALAAIWDAHGRDARPSGQERLRERTPFSFRPDPLRVELALRTFMGIAAVFIVMPLFRWQVSSMAMTLTFMVTALPTRAAMKGTAVGIGMAALVAWVISDLSIMYVAPYVGRMPVALVYSFALAGAAGYLAVRYPKLAPVAPLAAMIPIVTVFGGIKAPDNVQGPYDTTVVLLFGIVIGVVAQSLLFPRTAAGLFLGRAAGQLELCLGMLRLPSTVSGSGPRNRAIARALAGHAQQLAALGQLHAQAQLEPPVGGLDDARRSALLTGISEFAEAAFRATSLDSEPEDDSLAGVAVLDPLRAAVRELNERVGSSVEAVVESLRGERRSEPGALAEAQASLEACLVELRGHRGLVETVGGRGIDALIARIDVARHAAASAQGLEDWLADDSQRGATQRTRRS